MKRIFNKETHDYDIVPSENYGPNKYLVSDADGNPRWEENTNGKPTDEHIRSAVNTYLEENPVESTAIDATLTQSGAAADAAVVGGRITELSEEIAELKDGDTATVSGTVVNVNAEKDSQIKVSANTEQAVTLVHHGKNFIPFSNAGTKTGITYAMNADGSMTISGTATAKTYINLSSKSKTVYLPAGDYVASISGAGLANKAFYGVIEGSNKVGGSFFGFLLDSDGDIVPGTVDIAYDANAYICVESGVTVNATVKIQVELGSKATEFEAYEGETLSVESFPVNVTAYGGADVLYTKSGDVVSVNYKIAQEEEVVLPWSGKKWVCIGDSLTEANVRTTMHYHDYIAETTGINVVNMGISGTGYKNRDGADDVGDSFYQRISSVPTDADVVTIFGSGNDLSHTLGTPTDTGTETICGCINTTIDNLIAIMPAVSLGIVAPTPWTNYNPATTGNAMALYVEALKTICANRSIPFLDLYHCSNLRPWTEEGRSACYSKDDGSGIHPDENGHKLIAPRFKVFLDALIL